MRKKEIEQRITAAFTNSVPDALDNILEKCEKKKGFEENMKKENIITEGKKSPKLFWSFAAGMACAIIPALIFSFSSSAVETVVELDVNPSIKLELDDDDDIVKAIALNQDAEKVLGNMDFENTDLEVGVNAIVGSMIRNGYLTVDKNSVLVSVKNDNNKKSEKIQEEISKHIEETLKASQIEGSILTQTYDDTKETQTTAEKYSISEGKAKLIKKIIAEKITNANGTVYTEEELASLTINELNVLLNAKTATVKDLNTNGTKPSETSYIGKDKAKQIAFNHAGVKETAAYDIEVEFDSERGVFVYEVDFDTKTTEYEYDINATTGEIIKNRAENNDDYNASNGLLYDDDRWEEYDDDWDDDDDRWEEYDDDDWDD